MDDPQSSASAVPGARTPEDRLESWKRIAAYLKRDVSTVQRWERREKMPVHRHVHDKVGTVYAFRSELDAWWESRRMRLTRDAADEAEPAAPALPTPQDATRTNPPLARPPRRS